MWNWRFVAGPESSTIWRTEAQKCESPPMKAGLTSGQGREKLLSGKRRFPDLRPLVKRKSYSR
jgi:hypothetical protein